MFFKERKYLEEKYYEWIEENSVKDCPMSVIAFLELNGLLQIPTLKNKGNTIQVPKFNMTKRDNFKGE